MKELLQWLRQNYSKIIGSIAFYPAIMAILFVLLSWLMLELDFSVWGKQLKLDLTWLSLKDASTARVILSTITGGIISLTVFSFSMVMIILNQTASQLSNRILNSMIESRFQQIVLGCYIGTIVYDLSLLSTIRDVNSGIYVPALSIYLLILLTILDIFLFIYFLDYVTQTVKYETIIHRIQKKTMETLARLCSENSTDKIDLSKKTFLEINTDKSGYLQGFDASQLLRVAQKHNITLEFLHENGAYLIKGSCLMRIYGIDEIEDELKQHLLVSVDLYDGQPIEINPDYGFRHLSEMAIKALSPGINDPATAVLCIYALADLFAYRLDHSIPEFCKDENGTIRITTKVLTFAEMFQLCILPIWQYGKDDILVQKSLLNITMQLNLLDKESNNRALFNNFIESLNNRP